MQRSEAQRILGSFLPTRWCVLTGAPCSGKTTLLARFAALGYPTVPEVARTYIEEKLACGITLGELRKDEGVFQQALIAAKVKAEQALACDTVVILDRAMPDSIAYYRFAGLDHSELWAACSTHRYAKVFMLERLPLVSDAARNENETAAQQLDEWIEEAYQELGYTTIRVPVCSVDDRLQFIVQHLAAA